MARIDLEHISKTFGNSVAAVVDLDLTIPHGHFVCLLGPSGCGKTTTLRMIAGLETPDRGRIRQDERILYDGATAACIPTEKRGMGLVFQSYALWPHMSIFDNVAFGLEMQGMPRAERGRRVRQVLELLRIDGLEKRYPSQLSGGQQQRVALARMLAAGPDVLLLDEPLSNLDARLRLEMRAELKRLHERLGNTIIYVTHDQLEAMTMSTEVAVMNEGRLQQFGPPLDVYRGPANLFVAQFVGNPPMNLFPVDEAATAAVSGSILDCFPDRRSVTKTVGARPEALSVFLGPMDLHWAPPPSPAGVWQHRASVDTILPTGSEWIVGLRLGDCTAFARAFEEPCYAGGDEVTVAVDLRAFHLFDAAGERL